MNVANERVVLSIKENGKAPSYVLDGMTSDIEGNLFIGTWGGSKVIKVDPKYVLFFPWFYE